MKKFKLKQTIVVTVTGDQVKVVIIKEGTVLHEKGGYAYAIVQNDLMQKVHFDTYSIENNPELFELVTE